MTVRTKQLGVLTSSVIGTPTIYTVPAGFRAIVKEIYVVNNSNAGAQTVWIWGGHLGNQMILAPTVLAANTAVLQARWSVLNAGDFLQVHQTVAQELHVIVSGTELLL